MTTTGRIGVVVGVAAALVAATVVAVHYLGGPGEPATPVKIETPTPGAGQGPAAPPLKVAAGAPVTTAPSATTAPGAAQSPAQAAAEEGLAMVRDRPLEAQKRLSEALRAGIEGPRGKAVREALNELADRIQFSAQRVPDDPYSKRYEVVSGDSLIAIGQRFLVPYEFLMHLNRLGSPNIAAGQTLKVIQGPVHVEILKSRYDLQAWLGDACVRTYPVGLGAANATPEGTFLVRNKLRDPPYQPQHRPRSDHRASGAPDNPLGSRWIDIGNHYGIHGSIDPASIGHNVSEGCIRMHNKAVEELYDLVVVGGTKVIIRP